MLKFNKILYKLLRFSGLPIIFRLLIQKNSLTILMFHKIKQHDAEKAFNLLSKYYNFISLSEYINAIQKKDASLLPPYSLIITFDDGHINNYELLPIFKKYNLKPTIFLCAGIIDTYRRFWFNNVTHDMTINYLNSLSNDEKLLVLSEYGFYPTREYSNRQALTKTQIYEMNAFVDFQSHTVFHPSLIKCNYKEAQFEIVESKNILENYFQLEITSLAYPNGDFSEREIEICRQAGYKSAMTVVPGFNTIHTDRYKLRRFSVNDTGDVNELLVKSSGLWAYLKMLLPKFAD